MNLMTWVEGHDQNPKRSIWSTWTSCVTGQPGLATLTGKLYNWTMLVVQSRHHYPRQWESADDAAFGDPS